MNYWANASVVVTGAAGFIGSALVDQLIDRAANVRAFLHYRVDGSRGLLDDLPADRLAAIECVAGDLRDVDAVRTAVAGAQVVFHLGALVGIPYSYRCPRDVVETNVLGTLNVLEGARASGVERVVHTSTSEVYGSARSVPMSEAHPLTGQSPYAASKIGADNIAISFQRSFGVPVSIARPFNTYGPGQTARAIVPTVISQALAGPTLRLGAVTPTRDLNYVSDTVAGFLAIAETETAIGDTFNIGTGIETQVAEVVAIVGELVGRELEVITEDQRLRPGASEVDRLCADATYLREVCGWTPAINLREGLARTVTWVRDHLERFRPAEYAV